MSQPSPGKFIKPLDVFRNRNSTSLPAFGEAQSPLKCLNNLTEPSPTKKLPNLLRNPFNRPVKRKLALASPTKRHKIVEIDEDANLEPPSVKQAPTSCFVNDWVLKQKIRITFKNWFHDKISVESVKTVSKVYQHPYLAWLPMFPRNTGELNNQTKTIDALRYPEIAQKIREDWCESLEHLTNLLIAGNCTYFYLCSETYTILFKNMPNIRAYITPMVNCMGNKFNKLGIEFKSCTLNKEQSGETKSSPPIMNVSPIIKKVKDEDNSLDEDDFFKSDENNDVDAILDSIGLSQQECPTVGTLKKAYSVSDSSSNQSKVISSQPLVYIEGQENIRKLINFLKTNHTYTVTNVGRYASIPPTLLSPCEFRLSTMQHARVTIDQRNIEIRGTILPSIYKGLHKLLNNMEHTCQANQLYDQTSPFGDVEFT